MIYIGVDAHQSFSTFYGADQETGEIVIDQDKVPTQAQAFAKLFGGRKLQAVATVEASNISAFVAEMLEPFVERVVIADPKVVRQLVRRSRPKTDRVDAQELAWQLSRGLIHEVYQHGRWRAGWPR
jgi:transposase